MTHEEAAEEILKGPWKDCETCEGKGFFGEMIRIHDEVTTEICKACLGACQVLRPEYVCAALFLGLKVPDHSDDIKARQEHVIFKVADAAMMRILPKTMQQGVKVDQSLLNDPFKYDPFHPSWVNTPADRVASWKPSPNVQNLKPPKKR